NISVATTERRKKVGGRIENQTTWFRVQLWNRQAELANEYLAKGRQIYFEGRLRQEEKTNRGGKKTVSLEVTATELQFLGAPNGPPQPMPGSPRPEKRRKSQNQLRMDLASLARKVRSESRKNQSPPKGPSVLKKTEFLFDRSLLGEITCLVSPYPPPCSASEEGRNPMFDAPQHFHEPSL